MKRLCILLSFLLLTGCTSKAPEAEKQEPVKEETVVTEPVPEMEREPSPGVYCCHNGASYLAVDGSGQVIMEVSDGMLSAVKQNGETVGFYVTRTEGSKVDEWGWVSPEKTWSDIYDPEGNFRFSLPLAYVSLYGDLACGYNSEDGDLQFYSWTDGTPVYSGVSSVFSFGGTTYAEPETGGVFIRKDGTEVPVPEGYQVQYNVSDRYVIVEREEKCGLMNENAEVVLPCRYDWIRGGKHDYVYAETEGMWQIVEPETGDVLFEWPYEIYDMPAKDCVVVCTDDDYSGYRLVNLDGEEVLDQEFEWVTVYDSLPNDEILLCGSYGEPTNHTVFTADGTILYTADFNGYINILSDRTALVHEYDGNRWLILDLPSGTQRELPCSADSFYSQIYGEQGAEPYLLYSHLNEQGWYRHDILDVDGNVLLSGLQNCAYLGNGVVSCQKGFRIGLLRLDGTWLYEENAFAGPVDE